MKKLLRKWLGINEGLAELRIKLEERTRPNPYEIGEDVVWTHNLAVHQTVCPAKVVAFKINHVTLMWEYTVFDGKGLHTAREHELSKKPPTQTTTTTVVTTASNSGTFTSKKPKL